MHELSIVTYVVKQVQEIAKENNLTEIESVTLEFGEVSRHCAGISRGLLELVYQEGADHSGHEIPV